MLQGAIPADARVTMDGQTVRGTQLDLPPGTHKLAVRAAGYVNYERQVLVAPGSTSTLAIELQKSRLPRAMRQAPGGGGRGDAASCDQYGPTYNQDNVCFDTRPTPLSAPYIFLPADATETPRLAILLVKVSREGTTLDARVFMASNVPTFTTQALDLAKTAPLDAGTEERRAGRRLDPAAGPSAEAVIRIDPEAYVAPGAWVMGDVTLGPRASVWYGAVLRGDMDRIVIGEAHQPPGRRRSSTWTRDGPR